MADIHDPTTNISIHDNITGDAARVDTAGNLKVVTPPPEPPVGKTYITAIQISDVTGTVDYYTLIPLDHSVTIQRFNAGATRDPVSGSKVELYYAPNGNTTGIVFLKVLYVNGSSAEANLSYESPIGNGTRSILLRRVRLGGGALEIYGQWEGYY